MHRFSINLPIKEYYFLKTLSLMNPDEQFGVGYFIRQATSDFIERKKEELVSLGVFGKDGITERKL